MTEGEFVKTFGGQDRTGVHEIADRVHAALCCAPDLRPRWMRWADPHRRPGLVALAVAWFVVATGLELTAIALYGWNSVPIDHAWHVVAWIMFVGWMPFARWACSRRRSP